VEAVTQIEIDEQVTRLAEIYFPELCEANTDPRAELRFGDGMEWIRLATAGSLDLIIVDSTDPVGPAQVLFSEAFYRACLQALATGGLLAQQSESPLIHNDIQQSMRLALTAAGFQHQRCLLFPQCVYPSGWWSVTLARKGAAIDGFRAADVNARDFVTRYYNSDIHRAAFAMPEFLGRQLHQ
jgi:spermidine synthase